MKFLIYAALLLGSLNSFAYSKDLSIYQECQYISKNAAGYLELMQKGTSASYIANYVGKIIEDDPVKKELIGVALKVAKTFFNEYPAMDKNDLYDVSMNACINEAIKKAAKKRYY